MASSIGNRRVQGLVWRSGGPRKAFRDWANAATTGSGSAPQCTPKSSAHLTDHVFLHLLVSQWVLSAPKRLRYYLQRDKGALYAVLQTISTESLDFQLEKNFG